MKNYLELCKIRVVYLMLLCSLVGMILASDILNWQLMFFGCFGIGLCASSGAALNHVIDRHIDKKMSRTRCRPLAQDKIAVNEALVFAAILGALGFLVLCLFVNSFAAVMTLATLLGYGVIYTGGLKHITPQNIVIGGITGALPPLLGWICIKPQIAAEPLLLVLIIFAWTPPHFWALAIAKIDDYKKSKLPMLPVTHGVKYTKQNIHFYSWFMIAATFLPYCIGMFSYFYLIGCLILNIRFLFMVTKLLKRDDRKLAYGVFIYSIWYLMLLFIFMLVDHLWMV